MPHGNPAQLLALSRTRARNGVTTGFEDFIAQHNTFTEAQIQFIQTLKTFVLQRGTVEKENLIQPPFSALNPKGIRGLFKPAEIDEILSFVGKLVA